eukprot:TRINITY_DN18413_c0_g1_i1.p1 TRINITY_DN18413_c0_g1~~TRINITY_DN18413_c0_g1_i1.p1  ORF type:complete len:122 (-),score=41.78 TRINITY_DN18413_c0_g1_i1:121-453(-)
MCIRDSITTPGCLTCVNIDNSKSGYMTVTGEVRMIQVDKCRDLDVTLHKEAYSCHFVTSKVSNLNVAVEVEGYEGPELLSMAVPAQFVSKLAFDADGHAEIQTEPTDLGE